MNGILPVSKPQGMSSYDVIRFLQKAIPTLQKHKIGHGGTLDPLAEGVLLLLIGEATKLFDFILEHNKTYEVWIQFGSATTTDDADGEIYATSPIIPSPDQVREVISHFTGHLSQIPPAYSALKVKGKRAYELAREGKQPNLQPREVEIFSHEILSYDQQNRILHTRVLCSSGTYIRSLARDIGNALGCYGHVARLIRTQTLGITLEQCADISRLTETNWTEFLLPMRTVVTLPSLEIKEASWILQGRKLSPHAFCNPPEYDGMYQIVKDEKLLAIGEWKEGRFFYKRVFHA
ncbi:tRNA pseudouridine(55) synthase TruB [Thermospira aquatica]|uniref:tRNA pseudouridine synthase B n=1 Tax=Thermospira aquatica TaxID=2828656 RepID=A0AAX3BDF1_9SPIR|nr:tRNA pseudouridine(55) synthase TruB [Thermospira aquatica]URA10294.1 tRNA pseudouridine(55) synthase TruB [Thermospira aquatica]